MFWQSSLEISHPSKLFLETAAQQSGEAQIYSMNTIINRGRLYRNIDNTNLSSSKRNIIQKKSLKKYENTLLIYYSDVQTDELCLSWQTSCYYIIQNITGEYTVGRTNDISDNWSGHTYGLNHSNLLIADRQFHMQV